jgi:hypothetical protein
MKLPNLIEILEMRCDVPLDWIPEYWIESVKNHLYGATIMIDENGNYLINKLDYISWFYMNEKEINRWIKINEIIK